MRRDPLFDLFTIPDDTATKRLFNTHLFRRSDGAIGFRKKTAELGIYIACYKPRAAAEEIPHSHEFLELVIAVRGRGCHTAARKKTSISAGDIVFINNKYPHHFTAVSDDFEVITISFLPSAIGYTDDMLGNGELINYYALLVPFNRYAEDKHFVRVHPDAGKFTKAAFSAFHMIELYFAGAARDHVSIAALLRLILSLAQRSLSGVPAARDRTFYIADVLDYINAHYREPMPLSRIAGEFNMGRTYFSTQFNRITGRSLTDHISRVRVARAKALLAETGLAVNVIAHETGFTNVSHFSRIFKRITGSTPRAARDSSRHTQ